METCKEEAICRLCLDSEQESGEQLLKPCACRGSAAWIHLSCVKKWHLMSSCPSKIACKLCEQDYFGVVAKELTQLNLQVLVQSTDCEKLRDPVNSGVIAKAAQVLCEEGEYEEAFRLQFQSLAMRERVFKRESTEVAESLTCIGEVYRQKGEYDLALMYQEQALEIRVKLLGSDHPNTASLYNNIAVVLQLKGQLELAMEYLTKSVAIYKNVYGSKHPYIASVLNNLAGLFRSMNNQPKTLELYEESLRLREETFGNDHPIVAESLNNLAMVHSEAGDLEKAELLANKCLAIARKSLSSDHPELLNYEGNYGIILYRLGRNELAKSCLEHTLNRLKEKCVKSSHVWVVKFSSYLERLQT